MFFHLIFYSFIINIFHFANKLAKIDFVHISFFSFLLVNILGLPINNNNNKNSTTNGFNNNNNNNQNNINNNNNSSAPAEDRYAALKDLDEQLRESKAVAAQAASIVTANVVDSGFGNRK